MSRRPAATAAPGATGLTGRSTTSDYDVVRYTLEVVMPTTQIPALVRNLAKRNFHTVLRQNLLVQVDEQGDLYYYGTRPVMRVVIEGELLLLADWVRGKYDDQADKWDRPPLIPKEVLRQYESMMLLRAGEQRRLSELGG